MYKTAATNKREAMELNVESGNEGYVPAPAHQLTKNSSIRIKENDDGSSLSRAKRRQREAMTFNIESDAEDYVPAPPHQFTQILPQQRSQQIWKRHQSSFPIKKDDDGSILPRVKERPREAMTFNMESSNEGYVPAPPHQEDDEGSIRSFAHQEERTSKPLIQRRKALQPRKVTFEENARFTFCSSQLATSSELFSHPSTSSLEPQIQPQSSTTSSASHSNVKSECLPQQQVQTTKQPLVARMTQLKGQGMKGARVTRKFTVFRSF